jgi:hypothetical protein
MPRKQADVERALRNKGFTQSESHHHFFIYHSIAGLKTPVKTKTSHGQREISDDLLGKMAQQVKLSKGDFLDLVDCPLSREAYEAKLVAQSLVTAG